MLFSFLLPLLALLSAPVRPHPSPLLPPRSLYLVSDSTGESFDPATSPIQGFGFYLGDFFAAALNVTNLSRGGRSTRSYINEGLWAAVLRALRPQTFVVLQFGINDAGAFPSNGSDAGKDRVTLPGLGPATVLVTNSTNQTETVRTFGSYLRQMVGDVRAAGAVPVLSGMDPLMAWSGGVLQTAWPFSEYAAAVAAETGAAWVDHTRYGVQRWQAMGEAVAEGFFPLGDGTHTNASGAQIMAEAFVTAVKCQRLVDLERYLGANGTAVREPC